MLGAVRRNTRTARAGRDHCFGTGANGTVSTLSSAPSDEGAPPPRPAGRRASVLDKQGKSGMRRGLMDSVERLRQAARNEVPAVLDALRRQAGDLAKVIPGGGGERRATSCHLDAHMRNRAFLLSTRDDGIRGSCCLGAPGLLREPSPRLARTNPPGECLLTPRKPREGAPFARLPPLPGTRSPRAPLPRGSTSVAAATVPAPTRVDAGCFPQCFPRIQRTKRERLGAGRRRRAQRSGRA